MKPLTLNEVCEYWLYSKIGYPKGWHLKKSRPAIDIHATVIICSARVSSIPGYFVIEPLLKEFMMTGLDRWQDFEKVNDFRNVLSDDLTQHPIYAVETGDEPKTEIKEYRLAELATKFGCSVTTAYRFMDTKGSEMPGVFKFNKRWRVSNIRALQDKFQEYSRERLQKSA